MGEKMWTFAIEDNNYSWVEVEGLPNEYVFSTEEESQVIRPIFKLYDKDGQLVDQNTYEVFNYRSYNSEDKVWRFTKQDYSFVRGSFNLVLESVDEDVKESLVSIDVKLMSVPQQHIQKGIELLQWFNKFYLTKEEANDLLDKSVDSDFLWFEHAQLAAQVYEDYVSSFLGNSGLEAV